MGGGRNLCGLICSRSLWVDVLVGLKGWGGWAGSGWGRMFF